MRKLEITMKGETTRRKVAEVLDWDGVAQDLIQTLKPGAILALQGELGAGKTTFVQALAKELGIKKVPQSPTFSLMRTYPIVKHPTLKRLVHVDAYRIDDEHDLVALDLDTELQEAGTLLVIEWADKIPEWIAEHREDVISIIIH